MNNARKALILDFGGVISRTLFETHDITEKALGIPAGSLTWKGPFDPESDPLWQKMQADTISERDYWLTRTVETGELIGKHWTTMQEFVQAARGAEPEKILRSEAIETIKTAEQAGKKLAILSNELDLFYGQGFSKKLPLLKPFNVISDATYTKILKPDSRAYTSCIEELGLAADDCVFVDDQMRNIQGAIEVGMATVHFDVSDPSKSFVKARTLLGIE